MFEEVGVVFERGGFLNEFWRIRIVKEFKSLFVKIFFFRKFKVEGGLKVGLGFVFVEDRVFNLLGSFGWGLFLVFIVWIFVVV